MDDRIRLRGADHGNRLVFPLAVVSERLDVLQENLVDTCQACDRKIARVLRQRRKDDVVQHPALTGHIDDIPGAVIRAAQHGDSGVRQFMDRDIEAVAAAIAFQACKDEVLELE